MLSLKGLCSRSLVLNNEDLLGEIFKFIPKNMLVDMALVNKHWNEAMKYEKKRGRHYASFSKGVDLSDMESQKYSCGNYQFIGQYIGNILEFAEFLFLFVKYENEENEKSEWDSDQSDHDEYYYSEEDDLNGFVSHEFRDELIKLENDLKDSGTYTLRDEDPFEFLNVKVHFINNYPIIDIKTKDSIPSDVMDKIKDIIDIKLFEFEKLDEVQKNPEFLYRYEVLEDK